MFDIKVKGWLQGQSHILGVDEISNYAKIIGWMKPGVPCNAEVTYDDESFHAQVQLTADETKVMVAFTETEINLPPGMCITAFCDCDCKPDKPLDCYPNVVTEFSVETRLAVMNNDGCLVGNARLGDLLDWIRANLNLDIPTTLCDLMPGNTIPYGQLVGPDRVVTVDQSGCVLKAVAQSDVFCNQ